MSQVDEGLIHAWLDGQLPPDEAARIERLVATDTAWGAAAADARGVIAGASRILGALDDVPSVRQPGSAAGAMSVRRSVWRAPWLRAAAGIALVAGVGSLVTREWPANKQLDVSNASSANADTTRGAPVQVAAPSTEATGRLKAVAPELGIAVPSAAATRQSAQRDEAAAAKVNSRLDAPRVAGASGAGSSAGSIAPASAPAAVATPKNTAADSLKVNALALQKPVSAAASADAGRAGAGAVGGAGGGRGGRAAFGARPLNVAANAREQMSPQSAASSQIIDPRISGCWLVIDSGPSRVYVIDFIDPIVTDVQGAAAKPLEERRPVPMAAPRELSRPPVGVRVEHTTPRMISADSSFSAEWITGNERTTLLFTVRGDTLAGTTRRAAGDVAFPVVALRAVRAQCPP